MKKRSREINIFSMSALDLFASALGAFILITVVLFPYFPHTGDSPEKVAEIKKQLQASQNRLQASQNQLKQVQHQKQSIQSKLNTCQQKSESAGDALKQCHSQMKKRFLLALISWGSKDDVDLHVVDPIGHEYYYKKKRFPGSRAALEEDNTKGPGNEIWLHPSATPGVYKIYYLYYKKRSSRVKVRGSILTPDGKFPLPNKIMHNKKEKILVAIVKVDDKGKAHIRVQ